MELKQKFSFRKYGKILAPAIIGLAGLTLTNTASASEVAYIEDKTQTGGTLEEKKGSNGVTIIEVGTKENVVTEPGTAPADKHTVEYVADPNLKFKESKEIQKGQDAAEVTTTTYEVVKIEGTDKIVAEKAPSKLLPKEVYDYKKDPQKKLINAYKEIYKGLTEEEISEDLDKILNYGNTTTPDYAVKKQELLRLVDQMLVKDAYRSTLERKLSKDIDPNTFSKADDFTKQYAAMYIRFADHYNIIKNTKEDVLFRLVPETTSSTSEDDVTRYHLATRLPSEVQYEIGRNLEFLNKLDEAYAQKKKQFSPDDIKKIDEQRQLAQEIMVYRNFLDNLLISEPQIDYNQANSKVTPEFIAEFNKLVGQLPVEMKQVLPVIRFFESRIGINVKGEEGYIDPLGDAFSKTNRINMYYRPKPDNLSWADHAAGNFKTLIHELGHIIDYMSGFQPNAKVAKLEGKPKPKPEPERYPSLSLSPEFYKDVFEAHFKDKPWVWRYLSAQDYEGTAHMEAFAESFAQYILKRLGISDYARYDARYTYNGRTYDYRDFETPEFKALLKNGSINIARDQELYFVKPDTYKKLEKVKVFDHAENYFNNLYDRLFNVPRIPVISSNSSDPILIPKKNRIVAVGTKPKVETKILAKTTIYQEDKTKAFGYVDTKEGRDGQEVKTTTYTLNPTTGNVTTNEPTTTRTEPENTVVTKGTKPAERTETVARPVRYEANPNLEANTQKVKAEGKNGSKTYEIKYVLDTATGVASESAKELKSEVTAEDQVIEVGTKPTVETRNSATGVETRTTTYIVDSKTGKTTASVGNWVNTMAAVTYVADESQARDVKSAPVYNQDRTQATIKVGTKPKVETKPIAKSTVYQEDETKDLGFVATKVVGKDGEEVKTTTYKLDSVTGKVTPNTPTTKRTEPISTVIVKGTKPKVEPKPIAKSTVYQEDETKDLGFVATKVVGKDGEEVKTTTYKLDPVTGKVTPNTPTTKRTEPINTVIVKGTKPAERTEIVARPVRYEANPNLEANTQKVKAEGKNGSKKYAVEYDLDARTGNVTPREEVLKAGSEVAAVERVIEVGTKPAERTETVARPVRYVANSDLAANTRNVKVAGKDGSKRYEIKYVLDTTTGVASESAKELKSEVAAVERVIEVGTKPTERTVLVPRPVRYVGNPNLTTNQNVLVEGKDGSKVLVIEYDFDAKAGKAIEKVAVLKAGSEVAAEERVIELKLEENKVAPLPDGKQFIWHKNIGPLNGKSLENPKHRTLTNDELKSLIKPKDNTLLPGGKLSPADQKLWDQLLSLMEPKGDQILPGGKTNYTNRGPLNGAPLENPEKPTIDPKELGLGVPPKGSGNGGNARNNGGNDQVTPPNKGDNPGANMQGQQLMNTGIVSSVSLNGTQSTIKQNSKVTTTSSATAKPVGEANVLPKTSATTTTSSALPAGLLATLAAAGLLATKRRKED